MRLTPGTRLGPYTIESLIGSGGMGEVYKAHDGRLNRTVAIKRMIADDVSRFQIEARAIAAINHPHICQIYDVGPDYLVLEYLQGEVPLEILEDQVIRSDVVDLANVWMVDRGNGARFDLKPAHIVGDHPLDRDRAIQSSIVGFVDLAHASGADQRLDRVRAKPRAGS